MREKATKGKDVDLHMIIFVMFLTAGTLLAHVLDDPSWKLMLCSHR